jgi:hypothetical protein
VIVFLTWLYLTGLCVLVGGEINSEIEHAAPGGKAPGQKTQPYLVQTRCRGERLLSPGRFRSTLGPGADFIPAIADGIFEALPGVGMPGFPVAAGVGFQGHPVAPPVALVRA